MNTRPALSSLPPGAGCPMDGGANLDGPSARVPPPRNARPRQPWKPGRLLASFSGWVAALLLASCGKSPEDGIKIARTPAEAARQIDQAFVTAAPETRAAAEAASQAMRAGDFEKAVVSLQSARTATNVTLEQGLAIHSSTVALEARLIAASEAGDEKARRAYELLKAMKRK